MQGQDYVKLIKSIETEEYKNNVSLLNLNDNNKFDEELIKFNYNLFLKQIKTLTNICCNKSIKEQPEILQNKISQLHDLKREVKEHKEEKLENGIYGILEPYSILAVIESKLYRIAKLLNNL